MAEAGVADAAAPDRGARSGRVPPGRGPSRGAWSGRVLRSRRPGRAARSALTLLGRSARRFGSWADRRGSTRSVRTWNPFGLLMERLGPAGPEHPEHLGPAGPERSDPAEPECPEHLGPAGPVRSGPAASVCPGRPGSAGPRAWPGCQVPRRGAAGAWAAAGAGGVAVGRDSAVGSSPCDRPRACPPVRPNGPGGVTRPPGADVSGREVGVRRGAAGQTTWSVGDTSVRRRVPSPVPSAGVPDVGSAGRPETGRVPGEPAADGAPGGPGAGGPLAEPEADGVPDVPEADGALDVRDAGEPEPDGTLDVRDAGEPERRSSRRAGGGQGGGGGAGRPFAGTSPAPRAGTTRARSPEPATCRVPVFAGGPLRGAPAGHRERER